MFRKAQTIKIPTTGSSEGTTKDSGLMKSFPDLHSNLSKAQFIFPLFFFFSKICSQSLNKGQGKLGRWQNESNVTFVLQYFNVWFGYSRLCPPLLNISIMSEDERGIIRVLNPPEILVTTCQCTQSGLKTISHMVSEEISRKQAFRSVCLCEKSRWRLAFARDLSFELSLGITWGSLDKAAVVKLLSLN